MQFAVLTVDARTGHGGEACRVGSQDVALKIAARLRYEEVPIEESPGGQRKRMFKYERVTTMKVFRNGNMRPVVVR